MARTTNSKSQDRNNNNFGKNKKGNGKGNRNWDKTNDERKSKFSGPNSNGCDVNKGMNDPSWYAANPQLLKDSASFSYNAALGSIS